MNYKNFLEQNQKEYKTKINEHYKSLDEDAFNNDLDQNKREKAKKLYKKLKKIEKEENPQPEPGEIDLEMKPSNLLDKDLFSLNQSLLPNP
jgi:hypothetical protein